MTMSELPAFELKLQVALDKFGDEVSTPVDAVTLASLIADGGIGRRAGRGWLQRRPSWFVPLLLTGLLLVAIAASALVGAILLHPPREYEGLFVAQPSMSTPRDRPILLTLRDGRVLIGGGQRYTLANPATLEIFDPASGRYVMLTGDIPVGGGHAVQLEDGRVLLFAPQATDNVNLAYVVDPIALTSRQLLDRT